MKTKKEYLSDAFLTEILPPGIYADTKLPGFKLKVHRGSGRRVFILAAKPKGQSNLITYTIGEYKKPFASKAEGHPVYKGPLTAALARKEAQYIKALLQAGVNPNERQGEIKPATNGTNNFQELIVTGEEIFKATQPILSKSSEAAISITINGVTVSGVPEHIALILKGMNQ